MYYLIISYKKIVHLNNKSLDITKRNNIPCNVNIITITFFYIHQKNNMLVRTDWNGTTESQEKSL